MPIVDWDFRQLQSLIDDRGDSVIWEKGAPCPKCSEYDPLGMALEREGQPLNKSSIHCDMCNGDGYIYRDPQVIRGLITGVNAGQRQLLEMGFAMPGDAVFSPSLTLGAVSVSDFDRITFLFSQPVSEGQVIVRGAANTADNVFLTTHLATNEDRLWYLADCPVLCEDIVGQTYNFQSDYVFDDKKIVWVGNRPPVGRPYVIKYQGFLEWMIFASGMERFDNGRDLAPRALLRKKHVYFFNGPPGDSPGARQREAVEFKTLTSL